MGTGQRRREEEQRWASREPLLYPAYIASRPPRMDPPWTLDLLGRCVPSPVALRLSPSRSSSCAVRVGRRFRTRSARRGRPFRESTPRRQSTTPGSGPASRCMAHECRACFHRAGFGEPGVSARLVRHACLHGIGLTSASTDGGGPGRSRKRACPMAWTGRAVPRLQLEPCCGCCNPSRPDLSMAQDIGRNRSKERSMCTGEAFGRRNCRRPLHMVR